MSLSHLARLSVASLLAVIILSGVRDSALAEKAASPDLDSTDWATDGTVKLAGSGVKDQKVEATSILSFGQILVPAVTGEFAMNFSYQDGAESRVIAFGGTYALTRPGKPEFIIDRIGLQSQFDEFITDADLKAKLKTVKGEDVLEVDLKVRFEDCEFDSVGKLKCRKPNLTYKGKGEYAPPR